jgi:SH3-like domain-containing protein
MGFWQSALVGALMAVSSQAGAEGLGDTAQQRPPSRPAAVAAAMPVSVSAPAETPAVVPPVRTAAPIRDPSRGAVTNLPLPRFVSLKGDEGNARRGPGLTHRIDWIFTREGMPLKITAEYENWRRVEDIDGAGGWVHYSLLSGARSAIVTEPMVAVRDEADDNAEILFQAEAGVVARVLSCTADWCRIRADGERGWVRKAALWGVLPGELVE